MQLTNKFDCFYDIQYFEIKNGDITDNIYCCFLISSKIVPEHSWAMSALPNL